MMSLWGRRWRRHFSNIRGKIVPAIKMRVVFPDDTQKDIEGEDNQTLLEVLQVASGVERAGERGC